MHKNGDKDTSLSAYFNSRSTRIKSVYIPHALHSAFISFYCHAIRACEQTHITIEDPVHKKAMLRARFRFNNIPDEVKFHDEIKRFHRELLELHTDIQGGKVLHWTQDDAGELYVKISIEQAIAFHDAATKAQSLFNMTIDEVWGSDYLKNMTDLKNMGMPYKGETCLQEIINMGMSAYGVLKVSEDMGDQGRIAKNWQGFLRH